MSNSPTPERAETPSATNSKLSISMAMLILIFVLGCISGAVWKSMVDDAARAKATVTPSIVEYHYLASYNYGNGKTFGVGSALITLCGRKLQQSDLVLMTNEAAENLTVKGVDIAAKDVIPVAVIPLEEVTVAKCT